MWCLVLFTAIAFSHLLAANATSKLSDCFTLYDDTRVESASPRVLANFSAFQECHYLCRREGYSECSAYEYSSSSGSCRLFDEGQSLHARKIVNSPEYAYVELLADCFENEQSPNAVEARVKRAEKGEWGQWGQWGQCTASCGGGQQSRSRQCSIYGGCLYGQSSDVQPCNAQPCATWGQWGNWGTCSASCGGGQQTRTRQCSVYGGCPYGGGSDVQPCNKNPCCTEWSTWTKCSATCGKGQQTRERRCLTTPGNTYDSKVETQTQDCQGYVPVCASWSDWTPWSTCSATCGGGQQSRNRTCQPAGTPPNACPGNPSENKDCGKEPCPTWADWSPWSPCSVTCGKGDQARNRTCSGKQCPGDNGEKNSCDKGPCYTWSSWSEWSECTTLCGGGSRNRTRQCPVDDGCSGLNGDSDICSMMPCPDWGDWSPWSDCTVTCGGGARSRTRSCPLPKACSPGEEYESDPQPCGPDKCPTWADWSNWSQCSRTCGEGNRKRSRKCNGGDGCLGSGDNVEPCFDKACTLGTEWSQWSPCTATCGGGTQTRSRVKCPAGPPTCPIEEGTQKCNPQACPDWAAWGAWGQCSKTCGGGQRTRTRTCPVKNGCVGQATDIDPTPCNAIGCNVARSVKSKNPKKP